MNEKKTLSYDGKEVHVTKEQFNALQNLYNYFNEKLFDNQLGSCILNFSRKSKAYGFYSNGRWTSVNVTGADVDEISLNPDFLSRPASEYCATLVHEMVHLWQYSFGKPTNGYHNKEWAAKMKEIGLYPSSTGDEGGKETGKNCSHYILEGEAFDVAFKAMSEEMLLPFISAALSDEKKKAAKKKNKIKYTCPQCSTNAWGKPGLVIVCGECTEGDDYVKFVGEEQQQDQGGEGDPFGDF